MSDTEQTPDAEAQLNEGDASGNEGADFPTVEPAEEDPDITHFQAEHVEPEGDPKPIEVPDA